MVEVPLLCELQIDAVVRSISLFDSSGDIRVVTRCDITAADQPRGTQATEIWN